MVRVNTLNYDKQYKVDMNMIVRYPVRIIQSNSGTKIYIR